MMWHEKLEEKSSWYRNWHSGQFHKAIHWVVFIVAGGILTTVVLANITNLAFNDNDQVKISAEKIETGDLLVQYADNTPADQIEKDAKSVGGKNDSGKNPDLDKKLHIKTFTLPEKANAQAAVKALENHKNVISVEADAKIKPDFLPNDPNYQPQTTHGWHLPQINAPFAWDTTKGSSNVIIAILDTGVDPLHEDLQGKLVPGWNIYDNNSDTSDIYGHGTSVAGAAAEATNNSIGTAGVCPECLIMPIRITSNSTTGSAWDSDIANGFIWAADHGAKVANNSYRSWKSSTVASAAHYMASRGGVITIGAGNYADQNSDADNPDELVVTATKVSSDDYATWASYGDMLDLIAPGEQIYSTFYTPQYPDVHNYYGSGSGTSDSAPLTAGVAGLVMSVNPNLTGYQVQDVLKRSAKDLGPSGWDNHYGWGRIDAYKAVQMATNAPVDVTTPTVSFVTPTANATISGLSFAFKVSATDASNIATVNLLSDGTPLLSKNVSNLVSPYTLYWNTFNAPNGVHQITAQAIDPAGNIGTSANLPVNINNAADITPPNISVTSPANSSTVSGTTTISSSCSDETGGSGIRQATIYIDGAPYKTIVGNITGLGATWDSTTYPDGAHILTASATDNAGNVGASASVTITVSNGTGDTTAPTASITAPSSGSTVSSSVTINANSTDNVGVTKVEFYADNILISTDTVSPYSIVWDSTRVTNASHSLAVKAYDAAGNIGPSAAVTVTVSNQAPGDPIAPTISITSPASGATVSKNVNVAVSTRDNVAVTKVELYVDGKLTDTSTTNPFTTKWNANRAARGNHTLQAKAYDAAGNVGTSATITVTK